MKREGNREGRNGMSDTKKRIQRNRKRERQARRVWRKGEKLMKGNAEKEIKRCGGRD